MKEKLLTVSQLASLVGVSEYQIRKLCESRQIPFYRLGDRSLRFQQAEVLAALRNNTQSVTSRFESEVSA